MLKNKKIITIGLFISIFLIINLLTNINYLFRLFYKDIEVIYHQKNFDAGDNTYKITNINRNAKVIKILFNDIPNSLMIEFTNDDFSQYNRLNENYYHSGINKKYLYVYTSLNKINNLKITTYGGSIESVIINPKTPYKLNLKKTLLIFSIFLCCFYVFSNNNILDLKSKSQRFKCVLVILIISLIMTNYYYSNKNKGDYFFYNTDYTDSLINRRLDLDVVINDELINTSNPYDTSIRNFSYILDASYYNGKYYCYFGLLPNLLLFVPYKVISGTYMTNAFGCLIYSILSIIATLLLYCAIIKKYFNKITFRTFILSFIYIIFGSKLLWCMHRPNYYELVVIAAYFHVIIGLYLVLFNHKENKLRELVGSTFLASAVLCRPTALLASFLIVPKIIDKYKKEKFKITAWLPIIIPYLVIGIITMYLNYSRFGSIFEFGVSYQLSSNNLYASKFSIINSLIGSFYYLFGTYNLNILPFSIASNINSFPILTDYHVEEIGGGIILTSILGFMLFFMPSIIKNIKEKKLKVYLTMAIVLAVGLMLISASFGALIGRYMLDFNYLIYFSIVIISFYFLKRNNNKLLNKLYIIAITISIIINFMLSLSNTY